MKISELFETIRKTAGTSDKSTIMQANMSPVITEIFNDCYDNSRKYYVKKFNMPTSAGNLTIEGNYDAFHNMLVTLVDRKVTGNDAVAMVESVIGSYVAEDQPILAAIMDRNLKIGLSKETFGKLAGASMPAKFEVTLAYNLDKVNGVNPVDGTYYASRKCDRN